MILARPHILIKVTFLKHFALEIWVNIHLAPLVNIQILILLILGTYKRVILANNEGPDRMPLFAMIITNFITEMQRNIEIVVLNIGVAPITQLRTCVIKIVTFKRGHLKW